MTAAKRPHQAYHAIVEDEPGSPTTLMLWARGEALAVIVLGPSDCVRVASDLLNAARRRYGRLPRHEATS